MTTITAVAASPECYRWEGNIQSINGLDCVPVHTKSLYLDSNINSGNGNLHLVNIVPVSCIPLNEYLQANL